MKKSLPAILCLASTLLIAPASTAFDFGDMLKNYFGTAMPDKPAADQELIRSNLDTRRAQLSRQIAAGVTSGQLTPPEEGELRADLDRITSLQTSLMSDGVLSNTEVQSLLNELTNFSAKLNSYLSNTDTRSNSTYKNDDYYRDYFRTGNRQDFQRRSSDIRANIDSRQAQIDSAIMSGISSGRLSWNDAQNFRGELKRIESVQQSSGGRLRYDQAQQLMSDLDSLNTRVTSAVGGPAVSTNYDQGRQRRGSYLRRRIERARASGRLTGPDLDRLWGIEQQVSDLENQFQTTGLTLPLDEQRRLRRQIDGLQRDASQTLDDHQAY